MALLLLWTPSVFAETGAMDGTGSDESLASVLMLLAIIAGAYLFSHWLLRWATRRFGWVSGVQYVILGVVLGPVLGVMSPEQLRSFLPLLVLGSGAVGLMVGLELNLRRRGGRDDRSLRLAGMSAVMTLLFVVGLPAVALSFFAANPPENVWYYVGLFGAIALVADPYPVLRLGKHLGVRRESMELANGVGWLSSILAVVVFGSLFFFFNPAESLWPGPWEAVWWALGHVLLGGVLGAIAGAFIQMRPDDDRLMTILIAVVVLASGLAYVSGMSVVVVNFIAGVVIVHMSSEALRVERIFSAVNRPLYILLLFFVGTLWVPGVAPWVFVIVAIYLALRYVGRAAGVLAYRPRLSGRQPDPGLYRALWAPGALTAAMIIDASHTFEQTPYAAELATALVAILIGSEIVGHVALRSWLIDIADAEEAESSGERRRAGRSSREDQR
jgi:Kef-type K+ transport system membrane component KefB